jgi:phenylacetic acid degradation operon negative regulatory protein
MIKAILSSLAKTSRTSDFVYSSLSFFGRDRGGALPGSWFVEALAPLGVGEAAVRQTLYRMERSGALSTERKGRLKLYAPTATTQAVLETGRARILEPPDPSWDGEWTVVHFRFPARESQIRDRLRDVLMVDGFGQLDPGLYVHPGDRTARLTSAARDMGVSDRLFVVRGPRHPAGADERLVKELWDLAAVGARYNSFLSRFRRLDAARVDPLQAFGLRFAVVFEFFRITWDDPSLPEGLLPEDWPGEDARRRAAELYRMLEPAATEFADTILDATMSMHAEAVGGA